MHCKISVRKHIEHGNVLKESVHVLRHFADCTVLVGKSTGCLHSERMLYSYRCYDFIKLEKWQCAKYFVIENEWL